MDRLNQPQFVTRLAARIISRFNQPLLPPDISELESLITDLDLEETIIRWASTAEEEEFTLEAPDTVSQWFIDHYPEKN